MSIEAVAQFREAVNANEDWQEEIRNFGEEGNMVDFANGKGHAFTSEEYNDYVGSNAEGELSEFEMELVAGGFGVERTDEQTRWNRQRDREHGRHVYGAT